MKLLGINQTNGLSSVNLTYKMNELLKNNKDFDYFTSYNDVSVHHIMLSDEPRTLAYKDFIEKNVQLFKDKVIIDVGAGTGILSLFTAKVGAKKVYAIEASDMALICQEIVDVNGFTNVIQVIHDTVENTKELDGIQADVIVSEWMGFYLFHESMLETVLIARDRWLKPGGIIVPSEATVNISPVSMDSYYKTNFDFWKNVYGFDFSPIVPIAVEKVLQQPLITLVKPEQVLSTSEEVVHINLLSTTASDLVKIEKQLNFKFTENEKVHGFLFWFEVVFPSISSASNSSEPSENLLSVNTNILHNESAGDTREQIPSNTESLCLSIQNSSAKRYKVGNHNADTNHSQQIVYEKTDPKTDDLTSAESPKFILSTSPFAPPTHWKQTVILLPSPLLVEANDSVICTVELIQDDNNPRWYNISVVLNNLEESIQSSEDELNTEGHDMPCNCGAPRCRIIQAIIQKYDEQDKQEMTESTIAITKSEIDAVDAGFDSLCDEAADDRICSNNL